MRTAPSSPKPLGELVRMRVILAHPPTAMQALTAGSVASLNLSSIGVRGSLKDKNRSADLLSW
jgi:hypothetical protein